MQYKYTEEYVIADDVLISYFGKNSNITVPSEIESIKIRKIGSGAFYGSPYVHEIVVSEGIEEIGSKAFAECTKLFKVTLPESIECIAADAFESTCLQTLDYYEKIPYLKYLNVKESSILLTDRRYIFDPMALGTSVGAKIKGFMGDAMRGGFRVERNMGCLYACYKTEGGYNREMIRFSEWKDPNNIGFWYEHDEAKDDCYRLENYRKAIPETALLYFVKEGGIGDSYIKLNLRLVRAMYYFQNGTKVRTASGEYMVVKEIFFSPDDKQPYICNSIKENNREALLKYLFISNLI